MTKIHELKEAKISLEGQLEEEKRKVGDLFIDAEHLRSELHKEIKDYRKMKKNLKSIIVEFQSRLNDLRHREINSQF